MDTEMKAVSAFMLPAPKASFLLGRINVGIERMSSSWHPLHLRDSMAGVQLMSGSEHPLRFISGMALRVYSR